MQIYHPNIDLEGHVCLNILREYWKPVFDINSVIYGVRARRCVGLHPPRPSA